MHGSPKERGSRGFQVEMIRLGTVRGYLDGGVPRKGLAVPAPPAVTSL